MKDIFTRCAAALLLLAVLLAGCSRRDEARIGTPADPLVIVISPAHAPAAPAALDAVKKHIETATGMSVKLRVAATPADAVKAFDSGLADAGLLTLEEYLVARQEYRVKAALQALRGDRLDDYEGVLLARKDGPSGVADLNGKRVGFVGPYSVSGFTLPALYLEKAGVKPVLDFSDSHAAVLKKLLDGGIDAAATYARQAGNAKGLKVIAVTGRVPNEPFVTRGNMPAAKREVLAAAMVSLTSTPEGNKALAAMADITGFQPVDESVYRPMHDLLRGQGKAVYDLVPGAWEIYRVNQPFMPD